LKKHDPEAGLSRIQRKWLSFCIFGILMMNSINWASFERAGFGGYKKAALSWMFRHGKIFWDHLLIASVKLVLRQYDIKKGIAVLDELDRARCKKTKRIHKAYKQKDKKTGGYVNGQTVVLLLLVTDSITFPVGFKFYMPDPVQAAWKKEDKKLRKKGVPKEKRPVSPDPDLEYPTKQSLALELLKEFKQNHPEISVQCLLADALYGTGDFMDKGCSILGTSQVISQLHSNQIIYYRGRKKNLSDFFNVTCKGTIRKVRVRGGEEITMTVASARLHVKAHGKKRFVIAVKYEDEKNYRYLVATDMSWRTEDIIRAYTLRWLVEVFFEDWKLYEGWGQEARQFDEKGSSRSLILSLLFDHCLLLHPEQVARIDNKLPAFTVGSLRRRTQMEGLLEFIQFLLQQDNAGKQLEKLGKKVKEFFQLVPSGKHMSGRDLGRLEATPSLSYKGGVC
jgi:hypothetical protein